MKLYHFCCARDMRGIRMEGITKGMLLTGTVRGSVVAEKGWQWLTIDGGKDRQSWATRKIVRYDRTEYRFTVVIPEEEEYRLWDRQRMVEAYPTTNGLFDGWAGSAYWRVFHGTIPKKWLSRLERWNRATGKWEDIAEWR